jgi:hypothetical protein
LTGTEKSRIAGSGSRSRITGTLLFNFIHFFLEVSLKAQPAPLISESKTGIHPISVHLRLINLPLTTLDVRVCIFLQAGAGPQHFPLQLRQIGHTLRRPQHATPLSAKVGVPGPQLVLNVQVLVAPGQP